MIELHKNGVVFNSTPTKTARSIRSVLIYPPFNMVARYDTTVGIFVEASCSCGWSVHLNKFKGEELNEYRLLQEIRSHNRKFNLLYSNALNDFKLSRINYEQLLITLKKYGMSENRAEEWLDQITQERVQSFSLEKGTQHDIGQASSNTS